MRNFCLLLLCMIALAGAGCTGPHATALPGPAAEPLLFTNGSNVTDGLWISMNRIPDQEKGVPFTITGSTNLPAKSIVEVIIVPSGLSAAKIRRLDDCVTERQKCVLYFARANGTAPAPLRWSITTDDSMNLFRNTTADEFTAIVENVDGNLTARSRFAIR